MHKLASWCGALARITFSSLALLTLSPLSARAAPVVVEAPVAPPRTKDTGTGLCVTSAVSPDVTPFTLSKDAFNAGINTFIDGAIVGPLPSPPKPYGKTTSVLRTLFDLSNNNTLSGKTLSYGDFTDATSGLCQIGGCGFVLNDTDSHFASRLRGFLNVTPALSGKPIHIGFYADDAVSLTFFDGDLTPRGVLTQEPVLGSSTFRVTNTVTFKTPGLYPLEILYVELSEHAALEMAWREDATFTDFDLPVSQINSPALSDPKAPFTLFAPGDFFTTLNGAPPYPTDINHCEQCERQFVNQAGNTGCDAGYYCNDAALCAACASDSFCGPSCAPCGGATPTCINKAGTFVCGTGPGNPPGSSSSSSSTSSASSGSGGGDTGSGGGGPGPDESGGCGCGVSGAPTGGGLWLGLGLVLLARRRR